MSERIYNSPEERKEANRRNNEAFRRRTGITPRRTFASDEERVKARRLSQNEAAKRRRETVEGKAKQAAATRRYRQNNRDTFRATQDRCRKRPHALEASRKRDRLRYPGRRDYCIVKSAKYYEQNKTECLQKAAQYAKTPRGKAVKERARARRRTAMSNSPSDLIVRSEVFARDNWICQLCFKPVDPLLQYPDPSSASLDHVIPLGRDGTHTWDNVQLAHLICNEHKHY